MTIRWTLLLFAATALLNAQSAKLPADIDPQSLSRLPLLHREQLDANGQRVYDILNVDSPQKPRTGPTAAVLYAPEVGEPFERLNQAERKASVGTRYFEISTL